MGDRRWETEDGKRETGDGMREMGGGRGTTERHAARDGSWEIGGGRRGKRLMEKDKYV